jgi:hypothetical protein
VRFFLKHLGPQKLRFLEAIWVFALFVIYIFLRPVTISLWFPIFEWASGKTKIKNCQHTYKKY